jgi:HK97 family phage major capsid protein
VALKRKSEELREQLEAMRAEVAEIQAREDPSDEDLTRAEALVGAEWDRLEAEYNHAVEREQKVDAVLRANLEAANREAGDGGDSEARRSRGPEVKLTRDAFEADTEFANLMRSASRPDEANFDTESIIERARLAVDQIPRGGVSRSQKDKVQEALHDLLDAEDDKQTPLIARHILLTGSDEYRKQFKEYVRASGHYLPELLRTAMSLTAGNGGVLVPHYLDPTIILTNAGVYTRTIRSVSTVKTIATKTWEGVTSAGVTAHWTAEATSTTDSSPSFVGPTITPAKADAWVTGSYEVFEDTGFSSDLAMLLADAKARLEEAAFATAATSSGYPIGVVGAVQAVTASIVTSATTAAFVVGDVHNVSDAVNPRQENNLAWLAHKHIYSLIRQFDTSGGGGFWANMGVGQPPLLLGARALKSAAMTNVVSTGTNILLAGDFSQFYIIDRIGMSVIYDPLIKTTASGAAPTGQAGWYAHWRVGSNVVNSDAFRLLQLNEVAAATALA